MWTRVIVLLLLVYSVTCSQQDDEPAQMIECWKIHHSNICKPLLFFKNETTKELQQERNLDLNDCDIISMSYFCSHAYNDLYQAVGLNEPSLINGEDRRRFECKLMPNSIGPVLRGAPCFGALLFADCLTEAEWRAELSKRCLEPPSTLTLDGQCNDRSKYSKIHYMCNCTMAIQWWNLLEMNKLQRIAETEHHLQELHFHVLKTIAGLTDTKHAMIAKSNETNAPLTTGSNAQVITMLREVAANISLEKCAEIEVPEEERIKTPVDEAHRIISIFFKALRKRSHTLFQLATFLVANGTDVGYHTSQELIEAHEALLERYNAENYLKNNFTDFAEMDQKKEFVNKGRWFTHGIEYEYLDFLNEPNAHVKLVKMYKETFQPGKIDWKYVSWEYGDRPVNPMNPYLAKFIEKMRGMNLPEDVKKHFEWIS